MPSLSKPLDWRTQVLYLLFFVRYTGLSENVTHDMYTYVCVCVLCFLLVGPVASTFSRSGIGEVRCVCGFTFDLQFVDAKFECL
jgi:hypothetical protein